MAKKATRINGDEQLDEQIGEQLPRSVRLGDRVFLWAEEGGELVPRPAMIVGYYAPSKIWALVVYTPQGNALPYADMPYSPTPKPFHWTLEDQVEPVILD